ncbi:MAG: cytochrome c [Candidatus Scalindua sp.]|nr:cytochrome c [Candidatus Scalindua sp.]
MKTDKLSQIFLLVVAAFLVLKYVIHPRIPSSLLYFYMMIVIFAVFIYIISDTKLLQDFLNPIKSIIIKNEDPLIEERNKEARMLIFGLLPLAVAVFTYINLSVGTKQPAELRSIHPEPPLQILFREKPLRILGLKNPLRADKKNLNKYIEEGAVVYFENCFFCHGDNLDGNGHFAEALNPRPADFTDPGSISQLQESYLFWRISKGGQGLPAEGTPWNSAMPSWENVLTEEDIWKVIIYIYESTGMEPRRWEEKPLNR